MHIAEQCLFQSRGRYGIGLAGHLPFWMHGRLIWVSACSCSQVARGGRAKGGKLELLGYEAVPQGLDLVEAGDQITHLVRCAATARPWRGSHGLIFTLCKGEDFFGGLACVLSIV